MDDDALISSPEKPQLQAIERATLCCEPGDDEFWEARDRLMALPRAIQKESMATVLRGYFLFMEDREPEARDLLEAGYREAASDGEWGVAGMACARMALWHYYADEDWDAALDWLGKGYDCARHLKTPAVVSHLSLTEGRIWVLRDMRWRRGLEVLEEAVDGFRKLDDSKREIWAAWLRFEILPEDKRFRPTDRLASIDFDDWQRRHEFAECSEMTINRWAYCLAASGEVERAERFIRRTVGRWNCLDSSLPDILLDVALEALPYQSTKIASLMGAALDEGLEGEEKCFAVVFLSKHWMRTGRGDEAIELCVGIIDDPEVSKYYRVFARQNAAIGLVQKGQLRRAQEMTPALEDVRRLDDAEALWQFHMVWGTIWFQRGNFVLSLEHLDRGLEQLETNPDYFAAIVVEHMVTTRLNRIEVLRKLERGDEIVEEIEAVEDQFDEVPEVTRCRALLTFGYILLALDDYELARERLEEARQLASGLGAEAIGALCLANLAVVGLETDDDQLFARATASLEEMADAQPLAYSTVLLTNGHWCLEGGDEQAARGHFEEASKLLLETGQLADCADTFDTLSMIAEDRNEAGSYSRRALDTLLMLLSVIDGEDARLASLSRLRYVGARLADLQINGGYNERALQTVYEIKSGEFLRLVSELGERKEESTMPAPGVPADQIRTLRSDSNQKTSVFRDTKSVDPSLTERAAKRYRKLTHLDEFQEVSVEPGEAAASLEANEVAVEYFLPRDAGEKLFAFILTNQLIDVVEMPWSEHMGEVSERTVELIGGLETQGRDARPKEHERLIDGLRQLYDALIEPIEGALDSAEKIVLAPGASLGAIPFQALVSSEQQFFADLAPISFLVSTAQLAMRTATSAPLEQAVVLRGDDRGHEGRLAHADREVAAVREALECSGTELLSAKEFWSADLVHYGGHASFDSQQGMAASLFLEDRRLQAVDFLEQSFSRRPLVVLAGCETGRFESMGDEFVGFVRSIFGAGAAQLVNSSWRADDESATWLFEQFYSYILDDGMAPFQALARASRQMRRNPPNPQWRHPFYWANFRCWGAQ